MVASDAPGADGLDPPVVSGDHRHELPGAGGERAQIDLVHRELVALHGGQQIDVVHESRHPIEFGDADLASALDVGDVVRVHHLQVPAHDRDRRLQLVPHVVEQLPLHIHRALEPIEHRVDRSGEIGDVVVPLRLQARRQVADRDRVRGVAEAPNGRQQATGDEPADDADRSEHRDRGDPVGGDRGGHRRELGFEVHRPHIDAGVRIAGHLDRDRDVAEDAVGRGGGADHGPALRRRLAHGAVDQRGVAGHVEPGQRLGAEARMAVDDRHRGLIPARHQPGDGRVQILLDGVVLVDVERLRRPSPCRRPSCPSAPRSYPRWSAAPAPARGVGR